MIIKPNKSLLRSLERQYWRSIRKVFIAIRSEVVKQAEYTDPEQLMLMVPHLLQVQPMTEQLTGLWGKVGGRFAYDMDKMINRNRKAAKRELSEHEANMRAYASQRSLQKVKKILTTEEEAINRVISSVIDQANASGMSVVNTRRLLVDSLEGDEMMTIENWQAQRIALTEVNSAGNYGSFEELRMEGVKGQKSWITSGRSNVRDSHREHESLGWVDSDYDYATNLQFPGDPDCDIAEEVCNCHCTYLFEIED